MFVLMSSRICLKLGHLGSKTRSPGQILLKMFVLMSSRICSKLGHLVSKTRSPGQISRKLCYNHFELWSECLPWSVLDKALKVLCCSGERYRAIMALLFLLKMYYLHKGTSAVSCVKPNALQWEMTLCDDVGFPAVYRRINSRIFFTLSYQTSRDIHKCIRMINWSGSLLFTISSKTSVVMVRL